MPRSQREHCKWRVGRVAMQRIANPWTSVRLRDAPPYLYRISLRGLTVKVRKASLVAGFFVST